MFALSALARVYPSLTAGHHRSGDAQFLAGLEPGQRVRATVHANLAGNDFMVALHLAQAGERALHMKLPPGVHSGDVLDLVFISREPRPTFELMADASPAEASLLLSDTGRFIDNLLRRPVFSSDLSALPGAAPLLSAPPADGAELACSLGRALGRSGLFYEAHQAQWVTGARPLIELLLEPQARLSESRIPALAWFTDVDAEPDAAVLASDISADAYDPVHPGALALVRQQLEVFETRHFAWEGVAWPGQTITWEVNEEEPQLAEEQGGAGQSSSIWQTRLCLTMPNLGQVAARLRLDTRGERGVEVHLTVTEPATAAVLRAGAMPLAKGMESAGIKLLGMGVELDEEA